MSKITNFIKKETVLCIAVLLAVLSAFMVRPDKGYIEYIDFRTLAILFCLMSVMAGFQKAEVFKYIAGRLLMHVTNVGQLIMIPVMLCFFLSMFITNDVALITFVPFTLTILEMADDDRYSGLMVPIIAMQTVAANLGSMLTPIGNPQNLYLYSRAGISIIKFVGLMLPYTLLSFAIILAWCIYKGRSRNSFFGAVTGNRPGAAGHDLVNAGKLSGGLERMNLAGQGKYIFMYSVLFIICLLTVVRLIPSVFAVIIVLAAVLIVDRQVLKRVDYSLLLTFVGFFVFIGNMGRLPVFFNMLKSIVAGKEVVTSVIASQIMSNVPAALLLSGFTSDYEGLIIGTNLGGLGTLIASMASLISYKYVASARGSSKGKYIRYFTMVNITFLAALLLLYFIISNL